MCRPAGPEDDEGQGEQGAATELDDTDYGTPASPEAESTPVSSPTASRTRKAKVDKQVSPHKTHKSLILYDLNSCTDFFSNV